MQNTRRLTILMKTCAIVALSPVAANTALAQTAASSDVGSESSDSQLQDIVVTAQKRSESANKIGMSITALSGEALIDRGVVTTADLAKVVPGFSFSNATYGTPVYTLRGIGFNDTSIAASPAVSLYLDEVPLTFPIEAGIAPIDLQRVEVLKGPQGTLFGNNSTGGALNYIAAKPTNIFSAGTVLSYARFNDVSAQGFISGPLSSTLIGRLSFSAERSDDWQRSYTRRDTLGAKRQFSGRGIFEWTPSDKLKIGLNLSGWIDRSDAQAPQFIGLRPDSPGVGATPLVTEPVAPANARAADWSPNREPRKDQKFAQASLRMEYALSERIRAISISSFQYFKRDDFVDADGTQFEALDIRQPGKIHSFYQELRLSGDTPRLKWIAGANYSRDRVFESLDYRFRDSTTAALFGPAFPINHLLAPTYHLINTYAAFLHGEYDVTDSLSVQTAVRYTHVERDFSSCTQDGGDGLEASAFEFLQQQLKGAGNFVPISPGACLTLNGAFDPVNTKLSLTEHNVSWRGGINWTVQPGLLLYGSISKGYKSGGFPLILASSNSYYNGVKQESVLAYETGLKASLLNRKMQLNGAFFYYDYANKQLYGKRIDPVVGAIDAYVSIPKSVAYGAELSIDLLLVRGLTMTGSATYLHSEVTSTFNNFDVLSRPINFKGQSFPFTPRWSWDLDAGYEAPVSNVLSAFAGFHINARTRSPSSFGATDLFFVPARTLTDIRVGITSRQDNWRLQFWAKNITNRFYWNDRSISQDVIFQYAGSPRTFGLTFSQQY